MGEEQTAAHQAAIKEDCENWENNGGQGIGRTGTNYWHFLNCRPLLKYSDDDVDMDSYQLPEDFDLERIAEALTEGEGYFILRDAVAEKDIEMARERVLYHTSPYKHGGKLIKDPVADEKHNNYGGMIWGVLNKGKIFEKLVLHPVVRQVSNLLLGDNSQVSSLSANTVLQFVVLLTEFNKENGGTALRPNSHKKPTYP